jgi:hypothetical protein
MRKIPSLPSGRKTDTMGQRSLEVGARAFLKSEKKAKAPSTKEKSANSFFFLPLQHNTGNPVPESTVTRQGDKQGV